MVRKLSEASQLRIYLLVAFRLEQAGNSIHLPTRKTESLLAFLALHPGSHAREKLATLLWAILPRARHAARFVKPSISFAAV